MIPKRMFFYWDKPYFSWMRYMTLYSFRKMNPDWEMVLCLSVDKEWDLNGDHQRDFSNYKGPNYFDKITELNVIIEDAEFPKELANSFKMITPIHYSDLYRYYRLYNDGGFYSDMDVLYFRSMSNIYDKIMQSEANTVVYACSDYIAIGLLGADKGNEFYKELVLSAIDKKSYKMWETYGELLFYSFFDIGSDRLTLINKIENKYKTLKVFNIPKSLVYHYDAFEILDVYATSFGIETFSPDSIGYHWYGGHPTSQEYNNILDENNYMNYKITFSEIARELNEVI